MGHDHPLPKPVVAAIERTSAETGLDRDRVDIVNIESVDWPDASLGCPEPGMAYAQMITPGYRVILRANNREFHYHTDEDNRVIRAT